MIADDATPAAALVTSDSASVYHAIICESPRGGSAGQLSKPGSEKDHSMKSAAVAMQVLRIVDDTTPAAAHFAPASGNAF